MERAKQFLDIYDGSTLYKERFLSLYNGLFLVLKDELWERIEKEGISKERMKDALLYLREDEERSGKTILKEDELAKLRALLESVV